ncbi:MAG: hypothetical protein ACYCSF_05445 [Acidimicrobiales bacterium]
MSSDLAGIGRRSSNGATSVKVGASVAGPVPRGAPDVRRWRPPAPRRAHRYGGADWGHVVGFEVQELAAHPALEPGDAMSILLEVPALVRNDLGLAQPAPHGLGADADLSRDPGHPLEGLAALLRDGVLRHTNSTLCQLTRVPLL